MTLTLHKVVTWQFHSMAQNNGLLKKWEDKKLVTLSLTVNDNNNMHNRQYTAAVIVKLPVLIWTRQFDPLNPSLGVEQQVN
jgi:hypothetical protein